MLLSKLRKQTSLVQTAQCGFAANEKAIKMRIKAVQNIEKITKAMKMVAASKMKNDMDRLEKGKGFGTNSIDMIFKCDTYMQRKAPPAPAEPSEIIIPITTDKGLCGGINSGIVRATKEYLKDKNLSKTAIMVIGEKGSSAFVRPFPQCLIASISALPSPLNYPTCMSIADSIIKESANKDKIVIIYNEYKSVVSTTIRQLELIPKKRFLESMKFQRLYNMTRPDATTTVPALYDLYVSANIFTALLNNLASEQSARMTAMENASKNAGEIIQKLNLLYNQIRQTKITMELCEIIAGANAV